MFDKNAIDLRITIDTAYGFIQKYAVTNTTTIATKRILENYLTATFEHVKTVILQDFEKLEKANKIEVIDE